MRQKLKTFLQMGTLLLVLVLSGCSTQHTVQSPKMPSVIPQELINKANPKPIKANTVKAIGEAYKHNTEEAWKCNRSLDSVSDWYQQEIKDGRGK